MEQVIRVWIDGHTLAHLPDGYYSLAKVVNGEAVIHSAVRIVAGKVDPSPDGCPGSPLISSVEFIFRSLDVAWLDDLSNEGGLTTTKVGWSGKDLLSRPYQLMRCSREKPFSAGEWITAWLKYAIKHAEKPPKH